VNLYHGLPRGGHQPDLDYDDDHDSTFYSEDEEEILAPSPTAYKEVLLPEIPCSFILQQAQTPGSSFRVNSQTFVKEVNQAWRTLKEETRLPTIFEVDVDDESSDSTLGSGTGQDNSNNDGYDHSLHIYSAKILSNHQAYGDVNTYADDSSLFLSDSSSTLSHSDIATRSITHGVPCAYQAGSYYEKSVNDLADVYWNQTVLRKNDLVYANRRLTEFKNGKSLWRQFKIAIMTRFGWLKKQDLYMLTVSKGEEDVQSYYSMTPMEYSEFYGRC
jgi:hypothetical protein